MLWRNFEVHIILPSVCRWSEDYAEEEHAPFVWSSLTKTSSRLSTHFSVRQGVALDRKQCYMGPSTNEMKASKRIACPLTLLTLVAQSVAQGVWVFGTLRKLPKVTGRGVQKHAHTAEGCTEQRRYP